MNDVISAHRIEEELQKIQSREEVRSLCPMNILDAARCVGRSREHAQ